MGQLKRTRKVTYRSANPKGWGETFYPEIRISGKFLTEKYGTKIGDVVGIKYGKKTIVLEMAGQGK